MQGSVKLGILGFDGVGVDTCGDVRSRRCLFRAAGGVVEGIPVDGMVERLMQHDYRKCFVDALAWRLVNKGPPPDGPARFRDSPKDAR